MPCLSMHSEKPIRARPHLTEVSPPFSLRQLLCWPKWRWPHTKKVLSRNIVEEVLFCTLLSSKPSVEYVISRVPAGMFPSPEHVRPGLPRHKPCVPAVCTVSLSASSFPYTPARLWQKKLRGTKSNKLHTMLLTTWLHTLKRRVERGFL